MSPETGSLLAGYRIDGVAGRGGMGVVYRATELGLDRPVALKLIAPELAGDASFRDRFLRESRLAASLDHPGILPVYAAGEADGDLYLATRYVDGRDLRTLLRQDDPLPHERVLALVGQLAEALDAAHARGLVHRDVKPGNVLVDAVDHCYLCDFGLTKQLADGASTVSGGLAGSLDYLAPEQIRGGEVDGRTDEYALACVLYECLSSSPPFRRGSEAQTLWAHMHEDPAPLASGPALDAVLARGLAKEPSDRYETCAALVEDARAALGLGPSPGALRRRRRLGRRLLLAGVALVVAAATAAVLVLTGGADGPTFAPENSVAAIDPASRRVVAAIPVGEGPVVIAASEDWVWVINTEDGAGTISRIDPRSKRVVSTFSVAGRPVSMLAVAGSLWVGTWEGLVLRVDPSTDREEERWRLPRARRPPVSPNPVPATLRCRAAGLDVQHPGVLARIDPATSRLSEVRDPAAATLRGRVRLVLGHRRGARRTVRRPSRAPHAAAPGRDRASADTATPTPITTGAGGVWVLDPPGQKVWLVDPAMNEVERSFALGGRCLRWPSRAARCGRRPTPARSSASSPATGETEEIRVGADYRAQPIGVAVGAGLVWVSVT